MIAKVIFTAKASKHAEAHASACYKKLLIWADDVEAYGLQIVRTGKGYHDELLQGQLFGKRSIRLTKQWRAIYREEKNGLILIHVLEVTPHEY